MSEPEKLGPNCCVGTYHVIKPGTGKCYCGKVTAGNRSSTTERNPPAEQKKQIKFREWL